MELLLLCTTAAVGKVCDGSVRVYGVRLLTHRWRKRDDETELGLDREGGGEMEKNQDAIMSFSAWSYAERVPTRYYAAPDARCIPPRPGDALVSH